MKRFAIFGLSVLCLSLAATTSVKAETRVEHLSASTAISSNAADTRLSPFELISNAYQGEYRLQGIPGFGSFQSAYISKTVTAKSLVKAAIDAEQLAPDTQVDQDYLNTVELLLSAQRN
jgi:hypothetical protein